MVFSFKGNTKELNNGIFELAKQLGVSLDGNGYVFSVIQKDGADLSVAFDGTNGKIVYDKKHHFFRAFGLAVEHIKKGEKSFDLTEKPYFDSNGPMFDLSQASASFNIKELKNIIRQLSLMGLNMLMLYTEDNYEVKEQPYFGYMRPKYSQKELKELDDYAYDLGIEMIPCIQTLSHLQEALKWKCYNNIKDYDSTLLVGIDETYKFIEDIIVAASSPFRTKKIHIGMDEAFNLGKGAFLDKFGYKPTVEVMKMHLDRVIEIVRKHGLSPIMWDDMFFASFGTTKHFQRGAVIPEEVKKIVPEDMTIAYWDYSHVSEKDYSDFIRQRFELCPRIIFAGGIWSWLGYSLAWTHTKNASINALTACKKMGVKDVFVTTWADHGAECLINTTLIGCQLYAEMGYAEEFDYGKFCDRFKFITGGNVEDFENLEYFDKTPQTENIADNHRYNNSKYIMWQDILTGLVDQNIEGYELNKHYADLADKMQTAMTRNGQFNSMFKMSYLAAKVLEVKAEMGIRLTKAYKSGDKEALINFANTELPDLKERVIKLRKAHMECWFELYKNLGWDLFDLRYGGLIYRIESAIEEITAYLDGKLESLEELEQVRLPFDGIEGPIRYMNLYDRVASPSKIVAKV